MRDNKCQHPGCEARKVGVRVFCVEHCIANLEDRLSTMEIEHFVDFPTLPKPEPWKPRTKAQLKTQGDWGDVIQARTDDIVKMLEEIAVNEMASCHHVKRAAELIRSLE